VPKIGNSFKVIFNNFSISPLLLFIKLSHQTN
jgi:hypothetical protein